MANDNVCIVGIGYVGLTLATMLADKGFSVLGIDKDEKVIKNLEKGNLHLFEPGIDELLKKYTGNKLVFQSSYPEVLPETVIICVSTPIDMTTKQPWLQNLLSASEDISNHIGEGTLVILRSTVPVRTSMNVILPIMRKKASNVRLAFCPERTIQGKAMKELQELPQIIGGLNKESTEAASAIFSRLTRKIVKVSSLEAAELIKFICNCHTDLIYGFGNEVALMAERFGLEPVELINAANLDYPRPNLNLPGFVGGSCLSKDPYILISSFHDFDYIPSLVKSARELNESMPVHMAEKVIEKLKSLGKDAGKTRIFISGFAYKGVPITDDLRGTPAEPFINHLKTFTGNLYGHDYLVSTENIAGFGVSPCSVEEGFNQADCVVFLNNHPSYKDLDINKLTGTMNKPALLIDCWRLFEIGEMSRIEGLTYGSIGL
ncbi:nucleotide sugar dehydrogenase [Chloroflexota bacterium]